MLSSLSCCNQVSLFALRHGQLFTKANMKYCSFANPGSCNSRNFGTASCSSGVLYNFAHPGHCDLQSRRLQFASLRLRFASLRLRFAIPETAICKPWVLQFANPASCNVAHPGHCNLQTWILQLCKYWVPKFAISWDCRYGRRGFSIGGPILPEVQPAQGEPTGGLEADGGCAAAVPCNHPPCPSGSLHLSSLLLHQSCTSMTVSCCMCIMTLSRMNNCILLHIYIYMYIVLSYYNTVYYKISELLGV